MADDWESMSEPDKSVDESWKEQAAREKDNAADKEEEEKATGRDKLPPLPKPTFIGFIQELVTHVLLSLGELENPLTGRREINLEQAQYTIDILGILRDKTQGNLSDTEALFVENVLADMQVRYVAAAKRA